LFVEKCFFKLFPCYLPCYLEVLRVLLSSHYYPLIVGTTVSIIAFLNFAHFNKGYEVTL